MDSRLRGNDGRDIGNDGSEIRYGGGRMSQTIVLKGAKVYDPVHGVSGAVADVAMKDGRIVALAPGEAADETVDCSGHVVMAGGIDMHSHIGGGKVNLARLLLPELQRSGANSLAREAEPLFDACGHVTPGTLATGYRYVQMGYTAAFEPAMVPANARHAHMEMGDTPILDHGAYVMLGND